MKILEINKYYYLRGGSERYFFDIIDLLNQRGHTAIPFSMRSELNRSSAYSGYFTKEVKLDRFNPLNIIKIFHNYEAVRNLEKLIAAEKPDIAHLHNIAHQLSPAIISVLKKYQIPVVQTLHDYKLICPNYRLFTENQVCFRCQEGSYQNCFFHKCSQDSYFKSLLAALEAYYHKYKKTYDRVDLFLAPSQYMKDVCVRFGIKSERIKVLPNFISLTDDSSAGNLENYVLYFGRLSSEKGVRLLIESYIRYGSPFELKIVGSGPQASELKELIEEQNISDRIEIIEAQPLEKLVPLIRKAKAVVMPSVWPENLPYTALESMSLGKVVIASRIGGFIELIKDGENGMLFTPGDGEELLQKINSLVNIDIISLGGNAHQTAAKFNPDSHYNEIISIFNSLVAGKKSS